MISSAGVSWATAHQPSEQNGLIVHNIFTFVKYSEGIKPLLKNQTEDNLMSNMQEIYSSLVIWNTHICDIKKEQHKQKILNLWEYSLSPGTNDPCCSQKRRGEKSLLNERCSSILMNKYFLYLKEHFNLFSSVQLNNIPMVRWNAFQKLSMKRVGK